MHLKNVAMLTLVMSVVCAGALEAQSDTAIAGTVTDATGGVLPGVTVEVASPALIEGVRSAVTDAQGKYNVVNLRPGTYSVTFTLPGFSIVKREGVVLANGFTAPVNAEMKVGSLEETVTVTGASPIVDVQNVRTQNVLNRETLDALPNAQNLGSFAALTLGTKFSSNAGTQDVGGNSGEQATVRVHNNRAEDQKKTLDGMNTNNSMGTNGGIFAAGQHFNMEAFGEVSMAHNGMGAETETGGLQVNYVPKDGGNRFSGTARAAYTNEDLQSNNLSDELIARGASTPGTIRRIYDVGGSFGGPIKRDRLWFFGAHRWWGEQTYQPGAFYNRVQGTGRYEPDPDRRAYIDNHNRDSSIRTTWQASSKDKIAYFGNLGDHCVCFQGVSATTAPESTLHVELAGTHMSQISWNRVQTNRLLIDGGFTFLHVPFGFPRTEGVSTTDIPRTEISTNFSWNARASGSLPYNDFEGPGGGVSETGQKNARASLSYVTGSHAFKTGMTWAHGLVEQNGSMNFLPGLGPVSFRLLNGQPNGVVFYALPKYSRVDFRNMGFYAQDQWSLRRVTLNLGVRMDMFDGWSPEQETPAGPFVPAFRTERIEGTPTYRDVSPRLGAVYDFRGDGKTAFKAAVGRYVSAQGAGIVQSNNPVLTIVSTATRTWNDVNGDFYPDANELGPLSDAAFGTPRRTTFYDPDVLTKNRPYTWQISGSVEHELRGNMGVSVGYFRTSLHNQTVTDNTLVSAADFDPFCVTAPSDPRLPGGGGNQICGQYNVSRAKFGLANSLVRHESTFGNETEVFNGMDAALNARFRNGALLQGGVSVGRTVKDTCYVVDSPQGSSVAAPLQPGLYQCHIVTPLWAGNGQIQLSGVLPLPYGIEIAGVYQNNPGTQILANGVFTNTQVAPSLGRNLSACVTATGACNATVTVAMIEPNTVFEDRINQIDFRAAKLFRTGAGRVRLTFDLYNLLNNAAVQGRNNTFGSAWGTPTRILSGRLAKFGAQLSF